MADGMYSGILYPDQETRVPIKATCNHCQATFTVKDSMAGKKAKCAKCKKPFVIPSPGGDSRKEPSSDSTIMMPPPAKGKKSGSAEKPKGRAGAERKDCPECGKQIAAKASTCPHCGFNLKLGRKLSLTKAIKSAQLEPGVRADGSRYVTRQEKAKQTDERGRSIVKILFGAILGVVLLVAAIIAYVLSSATYGKPLAELREAELAGTVLRTESINIIGEDTFHPYATGYAVNVEIPAAQLRKEQPAIGSLGSGEEAWTQFAIAAQLPRINMDRFPSLQTNSLFAEAFPKVTGAFAPDALQGDFSLPGSHLLVVRQNNKPGLPGYLTGFLLDANDHAERLLKEAAENPTLRIRGRLYFVAASWDGLMEGKDDPTQISDYAKSILEGKNAIGDFLPRKKPGGNYYFFFPVVRIEE